MKTKAATKTDTCIPMATFKVVTIEAYESMLLMGEPMKCNVIVRGCGSLPGCGSP